MMAELQGTDCSFGGVAYMHGPGSHTTLSHPSSIPDLPQEFLLLGQELLFCRNLSGSQESPEVLYIESLPRARSPREMGWLSGLRVSITGQLTF